MYKQENKFKTIFNLYSAFFIPFYNFNFSYNNQNFIY